MHKLKIQEVEVNVK